MTLRSFYPFGEATSADVGVFRSLQERSGLCLASLDAQLAIVQLNQDFVARFGGREGVSFLDLLHSANRARVRLQFERLIDGRRQRFVEHLGGLGGAVSGDLTGIAVRDHTGSLSQLVVVVNIPEPASSADSRRTLTELDARILEGVAGGESTVRIASRNFLSRQGVEYHIRGMLKKLGAANRTSLVSKAYSAGVLSIASWPPRVAPEFVQ
ncbi:hypothetical protein Lesp02_13060 [Lentzea sp. NBRC 105346]|uniref:helix-turn-helix transcriptional regulator n=1 Tax=Lentzea sp. NBRC 105346 TaxID=3032205 RepID=UPI0024A34998|nr:LuxR C-terminal-related transcriptional regulator [Lentzea sp. NBRC 105346]GLZ29116.1 hypothetical protein Lesp02_13060 [Lentzea sp. NBRC 105346]